MKKRYRLMCRGSRGGKFYCVDSATGKRTSLNTSNEEEAVLTGQLNPVILKEACDIGVNALHEKPAKFDDSVALV